MATREFGTVDNEEISADEGADIVDRLARKRLGISGPEFAERWNRGDYQDLDHVSVMEVAMLLPLAR